MPRDIVSVENLLPPETSEMGLRSTSPPFPSSLLFSSAELAKFLLLKAEHKNLAVMGKTRLLLLLLPMQVFRKELWDDWKTRQLTKWEKKRNETESGEEEVGGEREGEWFWKTWKREQWEEEEEAMCPKAHAEGDLLFLLSSLSLRPWRRKAGGIM